MKDQAEAVAAGERTRRRPGDHLLRAAGLDVDLLASLPIDRAWYVRQLVAISFVATMAAVSLTTALTITTGASAWGWPAVAGAGLAALIWTLDVAISVDPTSSDSRQWPALARIGFAIAAGALIAMPLTAAIFARDVDHRMETQRASEIRTAQTEGRAAAQAAVRAQHGDALTAAQRARDDARTRLVAAQAAAEQARATCTAEIDGRGGSGMPGEGPRATAKCTAAAGAEERANAIGQELARAEQALQQSLAAELEAVEGATAPAPTPYDPKELGVVGRIHETHELLGLPASLAITAVLMVLDLLPIMLHAARDGSAYESIVRRRQEHEAERLRIEARRFLDDRQPAPPAHALADEHALAAWVRRRIDADPSVPATALHSELTAAGYSASYQTFTRFLRRRQLRPVNGQPALTTP
jgi:hypothetical protein